MVNGAPFVILVIIHNSTRNVYRALLQLPHQELWVSTHLPHAFDKSPHTTSSAAARTEREAGFSTSWDSYREMCHLDSKHSFYCPNGCNNNIMAKWFVWTISQHIIGTPERQNASSPPREALTSQVGPEGSWQALRWGWVTSLPPVILSPAALCPSLGWEHFWKWFACIGKTIT